ncbi:CRISPR system precrRNA processing endoribonuclease RAMP protein Cas6 [Umezakia ovalisporum]|uniref:CRISPR system precrRNA processing endoribonuclease RAMP protein Cas6 n=1 Tax=Umezakia ovalisporum TaxID=75695 RepID=UPI00247373E1|nr:CRISPR system precrRNA processing endoribonuclease RAMP protein Cas6 [Umezakia ovalisporum]MDH6088459.1 CRISPR system precrRNA processing endoribonuclease RAMP protein Cas6 [Umezakia ovalisporum Ak1311]
MMCTKDTEIAYAGVKLVLKSTPGAIARTALTSWLPEIKPGLSWIPLGISGGVAKIMPVLPQPLLYKYLMQCICERIADHTLVEWQGKPYEVTGVEVDNHALHVIEVAISTTQTLPASLGRGIHAQCFQWLAIADPGLAAQLHEQDSVPITLTMGYGSCQKLHLRISLLQKKLLAPLLWGLSTSLDGEITLGGIPCQLGKCIDIFPTSSFEQLVNLPTQSVIELKFLSPTSFKQRGFIQPFPLPELVFNSLLRRWNIFAPPELHFPKVEWNALISAFELKTHALKMEGGPEIGVEGWVKYRFLEPEQARIGTILAHFANFAGVGRKTAMGMGRVVIRN